MPAVPSAARLFKSLPPHRRPQGTDIAAVAGWTVAGLATAIWLVQVSPAVMSCLPVAVFFFFPVSYSVLFSSSSCRLFAHLLLGAALRLDQEDVLCEATT